MACAPLKHLNIYAIGAKGMGNDLGKIFFFVSKFFIDVA
jgi:hypothetical protein